VAFVGLQIEAAADVGARVFGATAFDQAIARRNIRKGEEITNDYREFDAVLCASFLKKKC
jgi:hypothetical protein